MNFRYDINGLRAIAVIGVVLYHFKPEWIPGGYAGVDVFFVISGFLMTGIIFKGLENNSFSVFKFYVARINRIVPALVVVCAILLAYGWFFLSSLEYRDLGRHVASSLGMYSNIVYWQESGYFDAASREKWLLHTWSLSVEWQFYLLYPIVLVALNKYLALETVKKMIILGAFLSLGLSVIATTWFPDPAYYLLPFRAWEMLFGGIAYCYQQHSLSDCQRKKVDILGLTLIGLTYAFVSEGTPWPGYLALIPVLGAYLVLIANRQDSLLTNNPIFQILGKLSYSIYLWHWPIVVIGFYSVENWHVWGLILSLGLGALSYKYVESIRFSGFIEWKKLFHVRPLLTACLVCLASVLVVAMEGFNVSYRAAANTPESELLDKYNEYVMDPSGFYDMCNSSHRIRDTGSPQLDNRCLSIREGGVFVWGDSHMAALSTGLRKALSESTPFSQLTSSGCAPSFVHKREEKNRIDRGCDFSNGVAFDSIKQAKPTVVILGAHGEHEQNDWLHSVQEIKKLGVEKVIIIGPFPQWQPSLPFVYTKRHWGEEFIQDQGFDSSLIESNNYLKKIANLNEDFIFIDMLASLCIGEKNLTCRAMVDKELLAFDYGHLTTVGSEFVAKHYVVDVINKTIER